MGGFTQGQRNRIAEIARNQQGGMYANHTAGNHAICELLEMVQDHHAGEDGEDGVSAQLTAERDELATKVAKLEEELAQAGQEPTPAPLLSPSAAAEVALGVLGEGADDETAEAAEIVRTAVRNADPEGAKQLEEEATDGVENAGEGDPS